MTFMWLSIGIVLVAVIYTACKIAKSLKVTPKESVVALPNARSRAADTGRSGAKRKPNVKWLSMKDCENLLRNGGQVLFVAIRTGGKEGPVPFPELDAISVSPAQLADVLRWVPPGKNVVLCGEVDLSTIIWADCASGITPIYLLGNEPAYSKAG